MYKKVSIFVEKFWRFYDKLSKKKEQQMNYGLIFKTIAVLLAAMIFTGCGKSKENAANTDGQANRQTEIDSQQTEFEKSGDGEYYDGYDYCEGCEGDGDGDEYYISGNTVEDGDVKTISVSNTQQFLESLGSNRIIKMEPGRYEMSRQLNFSGVKNLTIRGAGTTGDKITEIVLDDETSFIMLFDDCSDIVIENLKAGHSVSGFCTGGVFSFGNSSRISINGAYMYGSGTEGLLLLNVSDMKVTNSRIYECTYYIMTVTGGANISFEKCEFYYNKEYSLVNVSETKNLSFTDCEFRGNKGSKMFDVNDAKVLVRRCAFRGNLVDESIEHNSANVSFADCVFETGTVSVSNAQQFLEALGSNRVIEMEPGRYNLSEFDPFLINVYHSRSKGIEWLKESDGGQLVLKGIENLTIRGAGATGDKITEIVVEPRYSFVMLFDECSDIVIENLKAGHTEGGYCSGGVFGFGNSSRISINGADMYGSGTEGLVLENVRSMNVTNSRIYECTYDIMTVKDSRYISFDKCEFRNNKEFSLVNVSETRNLSFTDCEFRKNRGSKMFDVVRGSEVFDQEHFEVLVSRSVFSGNVVDESIENSANVSFADCVFE